MSVFEAQHKPIIEKLLIKPDFTGRLEGIAKYLYDRGFLVKKGTDEYRRVQLIPQNQGHIPLWCSPLCQ
ncbi:MAG: hypothetical protein ACE5HV_16075 [Acidobacteriota bacterium]